MRKRLLSMLVLLAAVVTGAMAQTETLADGSYYVKNGALSLYMAAGGEWGTHGIVNERGLDLIFTYNSGTKTYTIDSNLDNGSNHFLGTGLYMDAPSFGWTVEGENSFTISAILDGVKHYLAVDQNNNLVYTQDGTAENAQWIIIPKADHENAMLTAGLDAMKAATAENGVDATFLIACPGFNRNDKRNAEAWTVEANRLKMGGAGSEGNGCAESYNSTFTLSQTLSNAPAGVYTLTAQGFYKQNGSDNENLPYFYANDEKQTFKLLEDQVYNMSDAGPLFTQGKYTIDPITVVVAEDGALTIGAKLETNTTLWSCWDNFKLTYYGPLMYSVTLADGTQDADKWQAKAGDGEYQSLPLEGLETGTQVSLKYTGEKKVKSVKAASTGVQDPIDLTPNADGTEWTLTSSPASDVELEVTYYTEAEVAAMEALETAIAIASNINPTGLADAITAAQTALNAGDATAESMAQAAQTLEAAIKTYFGQVLPNLGAIVTALNDETLNKAYADAQAALAKEGVTPQELVVAMQGIITAAQAVAPEHLQNLKGYAVKYGATDAVTLIDDALAAIESGNVAQIIATMTAVKEAATPLAQQVLSTMISYVQAFGLTDLATQAQAALEGGNYVAMITTAKALFTHLIAAAKEYLPKLGAIAEGLNDETLNTAYAAAQELLAKESITPEELATAMQNIITAAQAVAPEHLQNLKGYAVKYGATDAATLIDDALAAIEAGNVAQIIATMTAVKEAATPLAQTVLGTMKNYVEAFGLTEQAAQAQAALEGGNYITMITTAKALFTHLIAAAKEYLPKLGAIAEGLNDETLNTAYAAAQELLAKESITPEELGAAMQNIIVAAKAVAPEHLQNLKGYALKYGAEGTATLVDNALAAIESGNVAQIIATMTAVKEAATPLATAILTQIIGYAQNYEGFADDVTAAQAALQGGNYITMIITAKALYAKLIAAANDYVTKVKAIPTEGKVGVDDLNAAIFAAEQALAAQDADFSAINTAIANLVAAVQAFEEANKGTGISVVKAATGKEVWYDMNGRRVAQPTKGLYIVNGKKVVVK